MAERDSWAVQGTGSTRVVDAEDARGGVAALLTPGSTLVSARQGIRPGPGAPFKVAATGTPGSDVTVQLGQAVLTASRATANFGSYITSMDAVKTVHILDVPADPSNQRNDLIIAAQKDIYYSDSTSGFTVQRVLGTASASPVDPSLATFPDNILLARVRVTAGATSITNAMIDDLRPGWTVALGGLLPVADATARAAITTPYDGQAIYRQDRDWVEIYNGTSWCVQGVPVCTSVSDRNTAITNPYNGLEAVTTDTASRWLYAGGGWSLASTLGIGGVQIARKPGDGAVVNTTTLASDGDLVIPMAANAVYTIECFLIYSSSTVADIRFVLAGPSGATGIISARNMDTTTSGFSGSIDCGTVSLGSNWGAGGWGASSNATSRATGTVITSSTAGNLQLQFAQNTAEVSTTTLRANSWMKLTRIA